MKTGFDRSQYVKSQGLAAEKIAVNYFSSKASVVEINPDEWGWWDIKVDGKTIQIKSLTPFLKYECWPINGNGKSIENVERADKLMIVSVPLKKSTKFDGWLLEVDRSKCKLQELEESASKGKRLVIPMREDVVSKVYKLTEAEENALLRFSTSYMTRKWTR